MKFSEGLHWAFVALGFLGGAALILYWRAEWMSGASIFSADHAYKDAIALFLAAALFGIGTLVHQNLERR